MREITTPEDARHEREAADSAWAAFLKTPAWPALERQFEALRRENIRQIGQLGRSDGDRAVIAGTLWVLEQFLSAPDKALQRLRMQAATSDAPETTTREPE